MALFTLVRRGTGSGAAGGFAVLLYAASPQFYFLEAEFSHQAVATALVVALACLLARSFDRGSPTSARRRDSRRTAAETPKVSVDTSTRPTPSAPAAAVSRTTMLAFSALGNTDALATSRRMSRPDIGLAVTPTVASVTSRWRLTRQPLACCSPIALPGVVARVQSPDTRLPQPLTRVAIVIRKTLPDSPRLTHAVMGI